MFVVVCGRHVKRGASYSSEQPAEEDPSGEKRHSTNPAISAFEQHIKTTFIVITSNATMGKVEHKAVLGMSLSLTAQVEVPSAD